jgi:hypothetical protein
MGRAPDALGGRRSLQDHERAEPRPCQGCGRAMLIKPWRVIAQRNDRHRFVDPLTIGLADPSSVAIDGCGYAVVAELVDATDLGSVRATCGGSNPSGRTIFSAHRRAAAPMRDRLVVRVRVPGGSRLTVPKGNAPADHGRGRQRIQTPPIVRRCNTSRTRSDAGCVRTYRFPRI